MHIPVLLNETVEALAVKPGMTVQKAAGDGELKKDGENYTLALDAGDWTLLTLG